MRSFLTRLSRDNEGAAAVEFALVIPVFLIFIFGIISFTQAFWMRNSMQYATDEAGRYLMINTTATDTQIRDYLRGKLYGITGTAIAVNITSATVSSITYKTITATYTFTPFNTQLSSIPSISLSTSSRVPLIP